MSEFVSILTIATGLSFLILNFVFHFGNLVYEYFDAYSNFVRRHSSTLSKQIDVIEENLAKNQKLYRIVKDPERKYKVFFQIIYSFVALAMILIGISSFSNATAGVIFAEISCVVTVGVFSAHLLLIRRRTMDEDNH